MLPTCRRFEAGTTHSRRSTISAAMAVESLSLTVGLMMSANSDGQSRKGAEMPRVLEQLDVWRKRLINLARSNRLLYFRHTRTSTLEIVDEPEVLTKVVDELLAGRAWRFWSPPAQETGEQRVAIEEVGAVPLLLAGDQPPSGPPSMVTEPAPDELVTSKMTARELQATLRTLERRSSQEFMDKGIWILYMAVGMLRWVDPDFPEVALSPLVLLPVQLYRDSPREPYKLASTKEDIVLNPALVLKLAELGVELPPLEEDGLSFSGTLDGIAKSIKDRPGWDVERRLVISPFSFHKEVMYRDLKNNEALIAEHPLVQALAVGAGSGSGLDFDVVPEEHLDEQVVPEETVTILDADATQMQCIAAATEGRSFVMDGPPGTGKSQTIANIIAQLLAKDRTVLFVSEKAAALEVVHKRLLAAGLGEYCLELHSHNATRKEVAQQLGRALELHPAVPRSMPDASLAQLRTRRQELSDRAAAMNEIRQPLGRSLHDAIGRIAQLHEAPQAPPPPELGSFLSAHAFAEILSTTDELARAWGPVARGPDFAWRELADLTLDATRSQRTQGEINDALSALHSLELTATDMAEVLVLRAPQSFEEAENLLRLVAQIEARPPDVKAEWLTRSCELAAVDLLVEARRGLALAYGREEKLLLEQLGSQWPALDETASRRFEAARKALRSLEPPVELSDSMTMTELDSLLGVAERTSVEIRAAGHDADCIASAFGLPRGATLNRSAELAELALLAGASDRPEPAWVNPTTFAAVEGAARALQPLCSAFNERREQLGSIFADEVLSLDLEGLCQRFSSVHRGLGKLRSAYRTDRKVVAQVARVEKATRQVVGELPQALAWKRLADDLRTAEAQQGDLLGGYYRSTATDFGAIGRALENARRAVQLAGDHLNLEAMARQVARGGSPDPKVLVAASRLRSSVATVATALRSVLPDAADHALAELDLGTLHSWCVGITRQVRALTEIVAAVRAWTRTAPSVGDLARLLSARAEISSIERKLGATRNDDQTALGSAYHGLNTNWDALDAAIGWASALRRLHGGPVSGASAKRMVSVELRTADLDPVLNEWHRSRDVLLNNFLRGRAKEVRADLSSTFEEAAALLNHLALTIDDIDEWVEFESARAALIRFKVGPVIEFCQAGGIPASEVPMIVERACLERWADAIIEEDRGRLRHLRADQLDPLVDRFRRLDAELVERANRSVVAACNARRPRTTIGAAGVIKREAEKQRRHMPVRKLLENAGEVAQLLKPCFMMSPLTVSQFLPASIHFDAVIFDEASQVPPYDAINCIYRGKQLVIAGDDKQLPPTSFFEAVSVDGDDEWEEDQFEEFESVIKAAKGSGGFRELPLRWHYRSHHEDLITYSNYSFYDGRLITFPGSSAEAGDLGVKLFPVPDGVYRRGTARDNPREAEVVADRVLHWAEQSVEHPSEAVTLGVVAFSEAQALAIETAVDRRRQKRPELDTFFGEDRLDGFFVKSLENVQGDERDVMVFSVGYGRDEVGKLTMNFGPLNREGGERRLNVAITRARRRVELVSSITGAEPEFATTLSQGGRHLQRYLDYAARGPVALAIQLSEDGRDAESPFEEEVIRTIRSWGYNVQPQVGTAGYRVDIGVWHPLRAGRFALGIECDGRMYHSSRVARDRDRLRQEVLEALGWRIYRIWGTSWYRYRHEEEQRLRTAIEAAIRDGSAPAASTAPRRTEPAEDLQPVALDDARSWTVPYSVAYPDPPTPRLEMHLPEALPHLAGMMLQVIDVEGPIEDELLLRRVREAWGVGRAGYRIRANFDLALGVLLQRRYITRLEERFTYIRPDQLGAVRVPGAETRAVRTVAQVSMHEQMNAVRRLVGDARRVSRDELTFEVCRLFGWNRRGSDIAASLEAAVEALVTQGQMLDDGEFLRTP